MIKQRQQTNGLRIFRDIAGTPIVDRLDETLRTEDVGSRAWSQALDELGELAKSAERPPNLDNLFGEGERIPMKLADVVEQMRSEHEGDECVGGVCWICHWTEVIRRFALARGEEVLD